MKLPATALSLLVFTLLAASAATPALSQTLPPSTSKAARVALDEEPATETVQFTDAKYGYSFLLYPRYLFTEAGALMMAEGQMKSIGKPSGEDSYRFQLLLRPSPQNTLVSSMSGFVESVDPKLGPVTNQQWAEGTRSNVETDFHGKLTGALGKTTIDGKDVFVIEYQLALEDGTPVDLVNYSYYNPETRKAYNFKYQYVAETAAADREAFDEVIHSLKLP